MSALQFKVYEIFKSKFGKDEAALIIEYFENKADQKINEKKDIFLTKDDKVDLIRNIYAANTIQFLATLGSLILIIKFMLKV